MPEFPVETSMKPWNGVISLAILVLTNLADSSGQPVLMTPTGSPIKSIRYITNLDRFNNPLEENIGGTPYLSDLYTQGKIYSKNGDYSMAEMRYNIYYDLIEFKLKDSIYAIGPDSIIGKIEIDKKTLVVGMYEQQGKMIPGYFVLVRSGRLTLFSKMVVAYREREAEKPMQDAVPPRYERKPDMYYYRVGNGLLTKVGSLKKLIESLPNRKKQMEEFAKRQKISARDPDELKRFVEYYNSL